ncbi:MAG: ammonium transporter [Pseudomonadota bacterium]
MKKKTVLLVVLLVLAAAVAWAGDEPPTLESNKAAIELVQSHADYVWTLVCAALVFFMQAGFAMVETGFTRAKNAVNILMKNLMDFSLGTLAYWAIGFGLMFGVSAGGFIGTTDFFLSGWTPGGDPWVLAFWMFQVVFAATAATIVSGAMAERTKFSAYLVYSVVVSAVIYPIFGGWAWGGLFHGGGWLESLGFIDFAGSTVVHSMGGWMGLAGALVLGPRIGKFGSDGKVKPILGHNLPLAALGVFILWLGWFGFNPGSTTAANKDISWIFVNTNMAAAAGGVMALIVSWWKFGKPDISMSLNGVLAGLVAITAPCYTVTPASSVIIGLIAGALVVFSVLFFDKIKIDDPVGAVSVHGVCGAWGTLSAGIFSMEGFSAKVLGVQALGVGVCFIYAFGLGFILFKLIDKFMGLRASAEEEVDGLDFHEHGNTAYPDFQISAYAQNQK